jgi:predicted nucleic acid-binding protein
LQKAAIFFGISQEPLNAFLRTLRQGYFRCHSSFPRSEIQRIFGRYRDRELDLADACLIHLASQSRTGQIFTLDRDFEIYRWAPIEHSAR